MKSTQRIIAGSVVALLLVASYGVYWTGTNRTRAAKALTIGFMPHTKVLPEIVARMPAEKVYQGGGAATPGRATRLERIAKALRHPDDSGSSTDQ